MSPFRICYAFLRIPRISLTLLVGPLLIGFLLVIFQLFVTMAYSGPNIKTANEMEEELAGRKNYNPILHFLYENDGKELEEIKVCRWQIHGGKELPLLGCEPKGYDIAIHTDSPATFDASAYVESYNGAVEKLHICRESCKTSIVIDHHGETIKSNIYSPYAMLIYVIAKMDNDDRNQAKLKARKSNENFDELNGTMTLLAPGYTQPILISGISRNLALSLNIAVFLAASLWLALKSHRKVLEYFGRNGALMPLVASCGNKTFYLAIWYISLCRVLFFFLPTLPVNSYVLYQAVNSAGMNTSLFERPLYCLTWIISATAALAFITILGSIADLKHRVPFLFVIYKYVPIIFCLSGFMLWCLSILLGTSSAINLARDIASAIPIVGLGPLLFAPVTMLNTETMLIQALLSIVLSGVLVRRNVRWFAAHLDEV